MSGFKDVAVQTHHIATKYGRWGERFDELFKKAGIGMDDAINKMELPGHMGRHIEEYHTHVWNQLNNAIGSKTGQAAKDALKGALDKLRMELEINPRLPYTDGGLR